MPWDKNLEELKRRRTLAEKMGGKEKLERQKARGKLDARERIKRLLDKNSFREIGKIAGKAVYDKNGDLADFSPSNFIFGRGLINGEPVVASADDFTVRGGAADAAIHRKFAMAEQMAHELKLPLIRMIDGTGGGGSVKMLEDMGFTYVPFVPGWEYVVKNLKTVPVVALALGPTAGLGAARMVASHYSVMVRGIAQIFTAGPAVVSGLGPNSKTGGENLDKEQLGGADIHTRNGVIDDEAVSEDEAFAMARQFLSYLPSHAGARAERATPHDKPNRKDEKLLSAVPDNAREAYSMRKIVEAVADKGSVFEMGKRWGRAAITAFTRFDGWPVAVLASDPTFLGGSWTADTAEKARRFVQLAEQFRLPVVHLVDNPGFMIGLEAERAATIRRGVEAMNGIYDATIPWATVIIRKAYGVAGAAMSDHTRFQYRFAWPSGDWGSLPMEGGVEVAYKSELEKADDPQAALAEIKARLSKVTSPFRTAEQFLVEDIIDPRETRPLLCEFAEMVQRSL
ncbi:MAG: carboxyl transferase domain-containing protein [Pseudomonadota bacterium]